MTAKQLPTNSQHGWHCIFTEQDH